MTRVKAMTLGTNDIGKIHEIKNFVRLGLFPKWKFFINKEQMKWSKESNSIAQFVVKGGNVAPNRDGCRNLWHDNKNMILKEINRKKNHGISQMEEKFKGE